MSNRKDICESSIPDFDISSFLHLYLTSQHDPESSFYFRMPVMLTYLMITSYPNAAYECFIYFNKQYDFVGMQVTSFKLNPDMIASLVVIIML